MSAFSRKVNTRKPRKIIRIYTEGEKTEPNYFNAIKKELRLNEVDVRVHGCGDHTMPLVERVLKQKEEETNDDFETEWWVVLDKDDHNHFNKAIQTAQEKGITVVYTAL